MKQPPLIIEIKTRYLILYDKNTQRQIQHRAPLPLVFVKKKFVLILYFQQSLIEMLIFYIKFKSIHI